MGYGKINSEYKILQSYFYGCFFQIHFLTILRVVSIRVFEVGEEESEFIFGLDKIIKQGCEKTPFSCHWAFEPYTKFTQLEFLQGVKSHLSPSLVCIPNELIYTRMKRKRKYVKRTESSEIDFSLEHLKKKNLRRFLMQTCSTMTSIDNQ